MPVLESKAEDWSLVRQKCLKVGRRRTGPSMLAWTEKAQGAAHQQQEWVDASNSVGSLDTSSTPGSNGMGGSAGQWALYHFVRWSMCYILQFLHLVIWQACGPHAWPHKLACSKKKSRHAAAAAIPAPAHAAHRRRWQLGHPEARRSLVRAHRSLWNR